MQEALLQQVIYEPVPTSNNAADRRPATWHRQAFCFVVMDAHCYLAPISSQSCTGAPIEGRQDWLLQLGDAGEGGACPEGLARDGGLAVAHCMLAMMPSSSATRTASSTTWPLSSCDTCCCQHMEQSGSDKVGDNAVRQPSRLLL